MIEAGKYSILIQWSDQDNCYIATVTGLPGCMAHGETQAEALQELAVARDLWLETAAEVGKEIPKPSFLKEKV